MTVLEDRPDLFTIPHKIVRGFEEKSDKGLLKGKQFMRAYHNLRSYLTSESNLGLSSLRQVFTVHQNSSDFGSQKIGIACRLYLVTWKMVI